MRLTVIGTGSTGNAYVLESSSGDWLLLDAGLPIRKMSRFLPSLKLCAGCLVTHEHADHCKGVSELCRRGVRVYTSEGTANELNAPVRRLQPLQRKDLKGFTVVPFETQHDAKQPFGYLIRETATNETVLYATDTYYLRHTFPGVTYWLVECNYVDAVLEYQLANDEVGKILRDRLMQSHMSLRRLKEALAANDMSQTAMIILIHLSDGRSNQKQMEQEIYDLTGIETTAARNGDVIELSKIPF